jgi:hypothetical protein
MRFIQQHASVGSTSDSIQLLDKNAPGRHNADNVGAFHSLSQFGWLALMGILHAHICIPVLYLSYHLHPYVHFFLSRF